jgi:hypothetical protein
MKPPPQRIKPMKYNKTELKLLKKIKFYQSLGFCSIDTFSMRRAARSLSEKGIVTISDHKHQKSIWLIRMVAA